MTLIVRTHIWFFSLALVASGCLESSVGTDAGVGEAPRADTCVSPDFVAEPFPPNWPMDSPSIIPTEAPEADGVDIVVSSSMGSVSHGTFWVGDGESIVFDMTFAFGTWIEASAEPWELMFFIDLERVSVEFEGESLRRVPIHWTEDERVQTIQVEIPASGIPAGAHQLNVLWDQNVMAPQGPARALNGLFTFTVYSNGYGWPSAPGFSADARVASPVRNLSENLVLRDDRSSWPWFVETTLPPDEDGMFYFTVGLQGSNSDDYAGQSHCVSREAVLAFLDGEPVDFDIGPYLVSDVPAGERHLFDVSIGPLPSDGDLHRLELLHFRGVTSAQTLSLNRSGPPQYGAALPMRLGWTYWQ